MLKVLIISHMYPSRTLAIKGIFIRQQVRHLKALNCEVVVVSPIPYTPPFLMTNQRRKEYRRTPIHDVIDGVQIMYPRYLRPPGALFHAPSTFSMYAGVFARIRRIVKDFRPHLIHAHAATPDGYVGLLLGKKYGIPTVVTLHGSDINTYPFRDLWTRRMTERVIGETDRVIAVSRAIEKTAKAIAPPRSPIEVIYNGADLQQFSFDIKMRDNLRKKLGISPDCVVLIFVGNVIREKGVGELMEAFLALERQIEKLDLLIVGDGPALGGLISKAEKAGVFKRVHIVGRRPHDEIPGWLSASDILILPSWSEGHPTIVVEAMACSRAVIASSVGGIPETIESGESGILVEKGNIRALMQAIIQLACDSDKREKMGQLGRQIAEQRFSWIKNAEKILQTYKEVLGEN